MHHDVHAAHARARQGHDLHRALSGRHVRESLLSVPKYDFNWQITYQLATPKLLPKGTKIEVIAHYDNSTQNKFNPDPTKDVQLGRSDVGRDDDRLLVDRRRRRRSDCHPAAGRDGLSGRPVVALAFDARAG